MGSYVLTVLLGSRLPSVNKVDMDTSFTNWLDRQQMMKEKRKNICSKYDKAQAVKIKGSNLIKDFKSRLLYCRNSKAGSTTWIKIFHLLSNEISESKYLTLSSPKLH